ncbi:hypothetical protein [Oceanithermus sp.]
MSMDDSDEIQFASSLEVDSRFLRVSWLIEAVGRSEAWVSDESVLRHFTLYPEEEEAIIQRVQRTYGVTLRPPDFELYLWQLVDELERRPRAQPR